MERREEIKKKREGDMRSRWRIVKSYPTIADWAGMLLKSFYFGEIVTDTSNVASSLLGSIQRASTYAHYYGIFEQQRKMRTEEVEKYSDFLLIECTVRSSRSSFLL